MSVAGDVGSLFLETAARRGRQPAVERGRESVSFAELAADVERLAAGFLAAGLAPGERVAVLLPPSREFYAAGFALFRAGLVPVLIDPGIGFSRMGRCLAETEPAAFVGSPKAHLARTLGGWAKSARLSFAPGFWPGSVPLAKIAGGTLPPPPSKDSLAAVLFTSGSTGAPKGALYTHAMFLAQLRLLRTLFKIEEGDVSVPTFPLFGLFDAALGQTCVLPDMDFTRPARVDPAKLAALLQGRRARQLFGSPALLDRLGRFAERHGVVFPDLARVLSAGAPVPARALRRMAGALKPGVPIHTPYGATEALPVALTDSNELLGEPAARSAEGAGVCVGRPVPGVEAAVIAVSDAPVAKWSDELLVPAGQVGEIAVRGAVVSPGYFRRPEADALAKIPAEGGAWHRMGDLGWRDEKGRLWFCGRKSQRVRTPQGELWTVAVEGVFNAHPAVRRTALVGVRGEPVLCVEREPGPLSDAELSRELLRLGDARPASRSVRRVLFHPAFPVDVRHNAKIDRERLAEWAKGRLS